MGQKIVFTDEQMGHIREQYAAGVPAYTIATSLGVGKATICRRLKSLDIKLRHRVKIIFTESQFTHIKTRYEETRSTPTVAKELGVCNHLICNALHGLGIKLQARGKRIITPDIINSVKTRYDNGELVQTMADELGVYPSTLYDYLRCITKIRGAARHSRYPVIDGKKFCPDCGNSKGVSEFRLRRFLFICCKECERVRNILTSYHMTRMEYEALYKKQGGVCAICHNPETRKKVFVPGFELSVDHNHKTGKNRGLLCQCCNTAIGLLKDDSALIQSALNYVETWQ